MNRFVSFSSCQGVKASLKSTLVQSLQLLSLFLGFLWQHPFLPFTPSATVCPTENNVCASFSKHPVQFCSIWASWWCVKCCRKAVCRTSKTCPATLPNLVIWLHSGNERHTILPIISQCTKIMFKIILKLAQGHKHKTINLKLKS